MRCSPSPEMPAALPLRLSEGKCSEFSDKRRNEVLKLRPAHLVLGFGFSGEGQDDSLAVDTW